MTGPRAVVIAPDKFRGSLTAHEATAAIARGFERVLGKRVALRCIPMADGGEGTVDVFLEAGAAARSERVPGPLGTPILARFAFDGELAVVESAAASGLALLAAAERDALAAATDGTGALMRAALDAGARRIVVGIGGTASTDGGTGLLRALGVRFLDANGYELPAGGAALARLATIDLSALDPRLRDVRIEAAADVDSPLCGPHGAAATFAPQKGADDAGVALLDAGLTRLADIAAQTLGRDERDRAGAGAGGGLGFALQTFLGATLRPGAEVIGEVRGLPAALREAALCVTGEGRIDAQTLRGKTVGGVARFARACDVPVVALAGSVDPAAEDALFEHGIACMPILNEPMPLDGAIANAARLVEQAAARVARTTEPQTLRPRGKTPGPNANSPA